MKVCVLGANSFSGQDFVDLILDSRDYNVIGISRSNERSGVFLKYKRNPNLGRYRYYKLDFNTDMDKIIDLLDFEKPDLIVNFAAQSEVAPSWEYPEHWYQTNCVSLARLVNHLRKQQYLRRYLHISSPEVYGSCSGLVPEDTPPNPSTPYAASKAAADHLLKTYAVQFGFPLVTVRATNVYGAGQQLFKIIPRSVIFIKLGKTIELHGGGKAVKSYIHIRDVSRGELAILEEGTLNSLYHLGPSRGVAVRDVVKTICNSLGVELSAAAKDVAERPGQDAAYLIDSSRAKSEVNWEPKVSLDEGISEVVEWVSSNWDEISMMSLTYEHKA